MRQKITGTKKYIVLYKYIIFYYMNKCNQFEITIITTNVIQMYRWGYQWLSTESPTTLTFQTLLHRGV